MHYMGPGGFYYPWVPATKHRRGYLDTRRRRRAGPVCDTCQKRHWPDQKCWTGPLNARRDLKKLRAQRVEEKRLERARLQSADIRAAQDARPPQVTGTPKREGGRIIQQEQSIRRWR